MELSLTLTTWKYLLLSISVLISIVDVALVSFGVEALGCATSVGGAYAVTALGTLVLTICFIAIFASLRESAHISIIFLALTAFCITLQTVFMVYFTIMKDDFMTTTANRVEDLWIKEQEEPGAMNAIQSHYYCCGKESAQDFLENYADELPSSCCTNGDCTQITNIYAKGCASVVLLFFDKQSDNMMLTLVGLILLEVLGIATAYYFTKSIQNAAQKSEANGVNE